MTWDDLERTLCWMLLQANLRAGWRGLELWTVGCAAARQFDERWGVGL